MTIYNVFTITLVDTSMWVDRKDVICCVTSFNAYFIFFLTLKYKNIWIRPYRTQFSNMINQISTYFLTKLIQAKVTWCGPGKGFCKIFPSVFEYGGPLSLAAPLQLWSSVQYHTAENGIHREAMTWFACHMLFQMLSTSGRHTQNRHCSKYGIELGARKIFEQECLTSISPS